MVTRSRLKFLKQRARAKNVQNIFPIRIHVQSRRPIPVGKSFWNDDYVSDKPNGHTSLQASYVSWKRLYGVDLAEIVSKQQRIMAHVRSNIIETIAMNALQNVLNVLLIKAKNLFDTQTSTLHLLPFFQVIVPSHFGVVWKPR